MLLRSIIAAFMWAATALTCAAAPVEMDGRGAPPWSLDERREIEQALIVLGHLQGDHIGNFGSSTLAAITQFQSFEDEPETGALTQDERGELIDMARRVLTLLLQPPASPKGAIADSLHGGQQRLLKAAALESAGDYGEAAYWYRLAALDDSEAKAFTNLGTLIVRGKGVDKADPAAARLLWLSAAARGEPVAMFDLGTMYERGIGVAVDLGKAKNWYRRAAVKGYPQAGEALKRLGA